MWSQCVGIDSCLFTCGICHDLYAFLQLQNNFLLLKKASQSTQPYCLWCFFSIGSLDAPFSFKLLCPYPYSSWQTSVHLWKHTQLRILISGKSSLARPHRFKFLSSVMFPFLVHTSATIFPLYSHTSTFWMKPQVPWKLRPSLALLIFSASRIVPGTPPENLVKLTRNTNRLSTF